MKVAKLIEFLSVERNLIKAGQIKNKTNRQKPDYKQSSGNSKMGDRVIYYITLAYDNVIDKIRSMYNPSILLTNKKIEALPITDHMKQKIKSLISMPEKKLTNIIKKKIKELHKEHNTSENLLKRHIFQTKAKQSENLLEMKLATIHGIGKTKAKQLIAAGIQSLADLNKKKFDNLLNNESKAFTEHNVQPVKREIIDQIKPILINEWHKLSKSTESKSTKLEKAKNKNTEPADIALVGSYRRGARQSNDIDVLIRGSKLKFKNYIKILKKKISFIVYTEGDNKVSAIISWPANTTQQRANRRNSKAAKYKMDIFRADNTIVDYYAMLLYTTGSKSNNIKMRARAKKLGMLLNQKGLYKNNTRFKFKNEKSYFDKLGIKYLKPEQR